MVATIVHDQVLVPIPFPVPPPIEQEESPANGMLPLTLTRVPGGPSGGFIVRKASPVPALKTVEAESPTGVPVAITW